MPHILVVNPNTSKKSSEVIKMALLPYLTGDLLVDVVNSKAGPEGIDTLLDIAISGIEAVKIIVENRDKYDGFVIACGADPGVDLVRQVTKKPVVGSAEAGMLLACTLGSKFTMLTGLPAETPILYELVSKYGLEKRLASIIPVHMDTSTIVHGEKDILQHNITAGRKAIKEDLAEVLVLAGSVVAGIALPLQKELGIPVVPGLVAALKLCEDLIGMDLWTSQVYKYYSINKKDKLYGYEDFQDVFSL